MEIAKWGEPFRLDTLYDAWDEAPRKGGVYVVYTGKTIQRAGGSDKKGILYIGKSLSCVIAYTISGTSNIQQVVYCGHTQR